MQPKPAAAKHFKIKNEWAAQFFKKDISIGKWVCQVEDKGKKCGSSFGLSTSKQNWVDHVLMKHKKELPSQFESGGAKAAQQLALTPFLTSREGPGVQVERLVVAYCMNPRVAFSTMDDPSWAGKLRIGRSRSFFFWRNTFPFFFYFQKIPLIFSLNNKSAFKTKKTFSFAIIYKKKYLFEFKAL